MRRFVKKLTLAGMVAASLTAGVALADSSPDAAIQYRKKVMDAIGANMGGVGAIAKGEVPFKAALATHLKGIALAASLAPAAFEQNTHGQGSEKTTANEKVWADWAKFEGGLKKLEEEATRVAAVADSDPDAAIKEVGEVGKICKGCHDNFRDK